MLGNEDVSYSLIFAVREGNLERARELINSFGLSYSPEWSEGYNLLCDAVKNNHATVVKLLLTSGSKVNSKTTKPTNTPLHFAVINGDIEIVKMILDKGANINAKNQCGETPLCIAIANRNMEVTELLLKHGADVNVRNNDGTSLLHVAAKTGCLQIVEHLLKYGAYVNCVCTSGWEKGYVPLHFAVKNGSKEVITLLLSRGANVDVKGEDGITPLHIATKTGHKTVVKLLLQNGAKVDNQDKDGKTTLHLAVEKGYLTIVEDVLKYCPDINDQSNRSSLKIAVYGFIGEYKKIVEALLEYGLIVYPEDANNPKLLHAAVENGYLKIIEDLLKYGADVNTLYNSICKQGFTPLHSAAQNSQEEVAKLLISYEADINAQDKTGKTPIFYAIENDDLKITKLLLTNGANIEDRPDLLNIAVKHECIEIVEALLKYNANIMRKDGITALRIATQDGHKEVVKVLLECGAKVDKNDITLLHLSAQTGNKEITTMFLNKGANVNAKRKDGVTALHIAIQKGHKEVVKVLLECGAKVDSKIKSDIKSTPLHLAAQKGYQDIIEIILKFGANIDSRDEYGRTALHIASEKGHVEVVVTLLEYGSDINITSRNNHTPLDHAMAGRRLFYSQLLNFDYSNSYYDLDRGVRSCEVTAEALQRHIVKIKTANLYVSEQNLLSVSRSGEISKFQDECEEEIASMKSEKINNPNISFYDILTKNSSSRATYMKNENIVQVLKSDDYKTKFPIYASMIKNQFRKDMERKELLEQGNKIFHFLFNNFPELPYDCTEKIFSYLSNEDLRILMDACKPLRISNPNTNINDVVITSSISQVQYV